MKNRTLTFTGVVIIILLLIATVIATISNSKNKRSLNEEKIQKETLASQKLQVSQELDKVKNDLTTLTTKNEASEKALSEAETKLADKEKRIAYLSKENGSLMKDRNELAQLTREKSDLDKSYADLKIERDASRARIKELEDSSIKLDAEKKDLEVKLADANMYRTDNIEIYGSRGNKKDKLTFYACRTKKINLDFDVPQSLTQAISFKIITPSNETITPEDKALTWVITQDPRNFTASLSYASGEFEPARHIVLTYTSKEKLKSGEYKIQIFSNDQIIGTCRVKLK